MKAIETVYDGYRFRSRLEARWACFFKTLGIEYEYEKEGYDLDGVWYLPDFWLPEQECFIEIKGQEPTEDEYGMVESLCWHSSFDVHVFWGNIPGPPDYEAHSWSAVDCNCGHLEDMQWDEYHGKFTIQHTSTYPSIRLIKAYNAARQARFEYEKQRRKKVSSSLILGKYRMPKFEDYASLRVTLPIMTSPVEPEPVVHPIWTNLTVPCNRCSEPIRVNKDDYEREDCFALCDYCEDYIRRQ